MSKSVLSGLQCFCFLREVVLCNPSSPLRFDTILSPLSLPQSSTGGYTEVTAQRRVYVRSGEKQITGKETETGKPGEGNRQEERHWDFTVTSFTPAPSKRRKEHVGVYLLAVGWICVKYYLGALLRFCGISKGA